MAYSAQLLIARAFYTSRIVSRGLQSVTSGQESDGLFLLNEILDMATANSYLIPYYNRYDSVFVAGQELYTIPNLLAIETMVFYLQTVRYPMNKTNRIMYFGDARVEGIRSLPFQYHPERQEGQMNVYVYYLPDQAYPYTIWGKFGLTNVTQFQDMSLVYDKFYLAYLRYALAQYICEYYGVSFPTDATMQLKNIKHQLSQVSPPDLTLQKMSTLQNAYILNYGQANIGKGYVP